jgi:hypothetical protein
MTAALAANALPVLPCALVEEPGGARPLQLPIDGTTRLMLHLAIDSISRCALMHLCFKGTTHASGRWSKGWG